MRKHRHKHEYTKSHSKFYNSVKKHGWDNFEWSVIYQSVDGKHCLTEMEPYFIREFNSFIDGYNLTIGGEGILGYTHNEERRTKIRLHSTGRKYSQEVKNKRSTTIKESWKTRNRVVSEEQREKISNSLMGNIPWNKGRKTGQKTASRISVTLNSIHYDSKLEAMNALNISLYKLNKLIKKE
jgi:group I intron endonuclease